MGGFIRFFQNSNIKGYHFYFISIIQLLNLKFQISIKFIINYINFLRVKKGKIMFTEDDLNFSKVRSYNWNFG